MPMTKKLEEQFCKKVKPKYIRPFLSIMISAFTPVFEGEDGKFYMVPVNDLIDPETQIGNYAAIVGLCRWPIEASIGM